MVWWSTPMQPKFSGPANERIRHLVKCGADPLGEDGPNVVLNLLMSPKRISPMYVYDKRGTELFEQQCGTPEYYLRRAEFRLLNRYAAVIVELCGFPPMVELGAGTAEKTRILLAQYARRRVRCDYFPIDVDTETLQKSACSLTTEHAQLFVHCIGATYREGLRALPSRTHARLFVFLGSSLGNMEWPEIRDLLSHLSGASVGGDHLLLGVDLDKDPAIIDRAYNDSAGYGARSTLNMLEHLNRRYGGNFVTAHFRYRSQYDPGSKRNEVRIESLQNQTVTLASLQLTVSFRAAELIDAEVMQKFDPDELGAELDRAGFSMVRRWIDPVYGYGLLLLRRK